jgi:hypothetical protein
MPDADLRGAIGREHKRDEATRRLARWSAGVLLAGWVFTDIDETASNGRGLFASLDDNVRDTLATLAVLPVAIPVAGLAVALFLSNGSFFRSAREVLAGPERAYTIDINRGRYLRRRTAELGLAWRRWLIGGWWLVAVAAGLATTAVTGALLRGLSGAWLAWVLVLGAAWLMTKVDAALTTGRYPDRPVAPSPAEVDAALAEWAVSSLLRLRPSIPPYGAALMQAYTGRSSAEIAAYVYETGGRGGPVVWMQRWLVVGFTVIIYSVLPAPSVAHFHDDGWWGRAFVNLHGVAGVAQDNLGTALALGGAAFALVPLTLAAIYARFLVAYRVPRPVIVRVLMEFRSDILRAPLYVGPSVIAGALSLALLLWLAAVVADKTGSAVLGFVALVVPGFLFGTAVQYGLRWLYTRGPFALNIRPHPLDPTVGAPRKVRPPRRMLPRTVTDAAGDVHSLVVAPDGDWLATGGADGTVAFWDLTSGAQRATGTGHAGPVTALAIAARAGSLASAGADGTLRLWDAPAGILRATFSSNSTNAVALAPDGSWLASGGTDGTVVLDPTTGVAESQWYGLVYEPLWLATLSAERLAGGSRAETVVWDINDRTGSIWRDYPSDGVLVGAAAVEPRGRWVARAREDGTIRILDIEDGTLLATLRPGRRPPNTEPGCIAVGAQGSWLAAGYPDGTVRVWAVRRGRLLATFAAHTGRVSALVPTADGTALVSGGADGRIRLWQVDSGAV